MKRAILILLLLSDLFFLSCATIDPAYEREKYISSIKSQLSTVTIADGISINEAKIISENYFTRFKKHSGGWSLPFDNGASWEIKQLGCITGKILADSPSLFIDKENGKITWAEGPPLDDPLKIWLIEK
jgi:hypothetical protein